VTFVDFFLLVLSLFYSLNYQRMLNFYCKGIRDTINTMMIHHSVFDFLSLTINDSLKQACKQIVVLSLYHSSLRLGL